MEEALLKLEQERVQNEKKQNMSYTSDGAVEAYKVFAKALKDYCARLSNSIEPPSKPPSEKNDSLSTAGWLYNLCSTIPSYLGTKSLASAILSACQHEDEMQVQGALFDVLGEGERAMELLFEIVPRAKEIRQAVTEKKLDQVHDKHNGSASSISEFASMPTIMDPEQERLNSLRQQAIEAAEYAALTKIEADALKGSSSSSAKSYTHTINRTSDKEIIKQAKQAAKAASKALAAAIEAGAMVDENEILTRGYDSSALAAEEAFGHIEKIALHEMDQNHFQQFQSDLLPEGTREYHEQKGLPRGTEREVCDGYEKVTIPAKVLSKEQLRSRIVISEVMNSTEQKAFAGTNSLNPMQSTVFEAAFNSNENLLICAPTGAGKVRHNPNLLFNC